jgi:hypothetical protein
MSFLQVEPDEISYDPTDSEIYAFEFFNFEYVGLEFCTISDEHTWCRLFSGSAVKDKNPLE